VANIRSKVKVLAERTAIFKQASAATGGGRAKLLESAISVGDSAVSILVYNDVVDQIIAADTENAAGLKDKYTELRRIALSDVKQRELFAESRKLFQAGDKEGAKKLLLEAQAIAPKTRIGQQIPKIIEANFK
jgi:hypothetical protein